MNPDQENHYQIREFVFSNLVNPQDECEKISKQIREIFYKRSLILDEEIKNNDQSESIHVAERCGGYVVSSLKAETKMECLDWEDDARRKNFKKSQIKLDAYNTAAKKITKNFTFFTKKTPKEDISLNSDFAKNLEIKVTPR